MDDKKSTTFLVCHPDFLTIRTNGSIITEIKNKKTNSVYYEKNKQKDKGYLQNIRSIHIHKDSGITKELELQSRHPLYFEVPIGTTDDIFRSYSDATGIFTDVNASYFLINNLTFNTPLIKTGGKYTLEDVVFYDKYCNNLLQHNVKLVLFHFDNLNDLTISDDVFDCDSDIYKNLEMYRLLSYVSLTRDYDIAICFKCAEAELTKLTTLKYMMTELTGLTKKGDKKISYHYNLTGNYDADKAVMKYNSTFSEVMFVGNSASIKLTSHHYNNTIYDNRHMAVESKFKIKYCPVKTHNFTNDTSYNNRLDNNYIVVHVIINEDTDMYNFIRCLMLCEYGKRNAVLWLIILCSAVCLRTMKSKQF